MMFDGAGGGNDVSVRELSRHDLSIAVEGPFIGFIDSDLPIRMLHDHGFGIAVQKLSIFVLLVDNRRASWIGARVDTRERGYPRQLPQNASELKEALRHLMRRS